MCNPNCNPNCNSKHIFSINYTEISILRYTLQTDYFG
nr:MAG TPA: Paramyx-P Zinc-binding domain of Paramyxoviridae V protein [Caudoviricetes sp.]